METFCGFGSADDPEHVKGCIACNRGVWREHRRDHPSRVRRWLNWALDKMFGTDGMPVPPAPLPPDKAKIHEGLRKWR